MSVESQQIRHIYAVNNTKKEIFAVPINSTHEENDTIDAEAQLFLRALQISFHKFKDNNWNYATDEIKRVLDTDFNLIEY